jgi:hypothetical protein
LSISFHPPVDLVAAYLRSEALAALENNDTSNSLISYRRRTTGEPIAGAQATGGAPQAGDSVGEIKAW